MSSLKYIDSEDVPVAFECSSVYELSKLVDYSRKLSKGPVFVLLLKKDEKLIIRLLPAYLNARIRYLESYTKAKSLPIEILLFVAGTMRTDIAIKKCGATNKNNFIVFASNKKILSRFAKEMKIRRIKAYDLRFDLNVAGEVSAVGLAED